jgi:hypothetical protein
VLKKCDGRKWLWRMDAMCFLFHFMGIKNLAKFDAHSGRELKMSAAVGGQGGRGSYTVRQ